MPKKIKSIDPLAEVKKSKHFKQYSAEADERIRLGVEIYKTRELLKISQQELARQAKTTQKVISRIESADVNIGYALLNRIARVLKFNCENWSRMLEFPVTVAMIIDSSKLTSGNNSEASEDDLLKTNHTSEANLLTYNT